MPLPAVAAAAGRVGAQVGKAAAKGAAKGAKAAGRGAAKGAKAAGRKAGQAGRKAGQKIADRAKKKAQDSAMDKLSGKDKDEDDDKEKNKKERGFGKAMNALQQPGGAGGMPGAGGGGGAGGAKMPKGAAVASKLKPLFSFLPGKSGDYAWDATVIGMGASFVLSKAAGWIMLEEGGITEKNVKRSAIIIAIWGLLFLLLVGLVVIIAYCEAHPIKCGWEAYKAGASLWDLIKLAF